MSTLRIHLRFQDGRREDLAIEADRALIGSGAHCEVRLPVDAARLEHVAVQVTPTGVYAQTLSFDPPPLVNGLAFTQGALLPDTAMILGNVEIFVQTTDDRPAAAVVKSSSQGTSPTTVGLALVFCVLAGVVLTMDDEPPGLGEPPKKTPELFEAVVDKCPQQGAQALAIASERHAVADTKRERSPFDVRDGVASVPLYETASACYRVGGEQQAAAETKAASDTLRAKLAEDYRTHVVWLEHCIKSQDWRAAQREVALLMAYTEGKKGEYVTYLSNLERQLRIKYGQRTP